MKTIRYVITDPVGIHARPAGQLVKLAKAAASKVTVHANGKQADGKSIFGITGLGAKQGAELVLTIEGADEETAAQALEAYLREAL